MPTPIVAAVAPPRLTSTGARSAPTAVPAMISASRIPKTRASTLAGAVRCSSVRPATSNRLRAAPATASNSSAPTACDATVMTANAAAQTPRDAMTAGISRARPDERRGERDSDDAAGAKRCIEIAGAPLTHPERADREHDIEDIEHADRDALRAEQPDEESRLRLVAEHLSPPATRPPCRSSRPESLPVALDRQDEHRADKDERSHQQEHPAGPPGGDQ